MILSILFLGTAITGGVILSNIYSVSDTTSEGGNSANEDSENITINDGNSSEDVNNGNSGDEINDDDYIVNAQAVSFSVKVNITNSSYGSVAYDWGSVGYHSISYTGNNKTISSGTTIKNSSYSVLRLTITLSSSSYYYTFSYGSSSGNRVTSTTSYLYCYIDKVHGNILAVSSGAPNFTYVATSGSYSQTINISFARHTTTLVYVRAYYTTNLSSFPGSSVGGTISIRYTNSSGSSSSESSIFNSLYGVRTNSYVSLTARAKTGYKLYGWYTSSSVTSSNYSNPVSTSTSYSFTPTSTSTQYRCALFVENTPPVISNATWALYNDDTYYVYAQVTDNYRLDRVQFPTWTALNDQDDIQSNWPTNSSASGTLGSYSYNGNSYNYRYIVKVSDHKYEYDGIYYTHIYAYDAVGNQSECWALNDIVFTWELTFDGNGVTSPSNISYTARNNQTLPTMVRDGYTFLGWKPSSSSGSWNSATTYASGTNCNSYHGSVTLVAQWQANPQAVTVNANGGSFRKNIVTASSIAKDSTVTGNNAQIAYDASSGKYTFTITTNNDPYATTSTKVNLTAGTTYYMHVRLENTSGNLITTPDALQVFYAINVGYNEPMSLRFTGDQTQSFTVSTSGTYDIRFDNDIGDTFVIKDFWIGQSTTVSSTTYSILTDSSFQLSEPTRTGYTFTGWSTSNTSSLVDGNVVTVGPSAVTLTAQWTANQYDVVYYYRNSSGNTATTTYKRTFGQSFTLYNSSNISTYTSNGWSLYGWAASSSAYNASYTAGQAISNYNSSTSTVNLYAISTRTVSINYNLNGGTGNISSTSQTQNWNEYGNTYNFSSAGVTSTIPTKVGFSFSDWNTTSNGTGSNYSSGAIISFAYNLTSSISLYAVWEANNPAYYDENGDYWYVEIGEMPQTKITSSSTISGLNSSTTTGSSFTIGGVSLTSKIYNNVEACLWNGSWYQVEPIRWRLVSSSSQTNGYGTTDDTFAVMDQIVWVGQFSTSSLGEGNGYMNNNLYTFSTSGSGINNNSYLVNFSANVETFGSTGITTSSISRNLFTVSTDEIDTYYGDRDVEFSDLAADMIRESGNILLYYTRDLGDNTNNITCLNRVGNETQRSAQEMLGVRFLIKVTEYGCVA